MFLCFTSSFLLLSCSKKKIQTNESKSASSQSVNDESKKAFSVQDESTRRVCSPGADGKLSCHKESIQKK
jgi:hypothetical protein